MVCQALAAGEDQRYRLSMADFAPLLEADALDARILNAIAEVMRERDILVLDTYRGLDRTTGEPAWFVTRL
jgi:hypothetical protein